MKNKIRMLKICLFFLLLFALPAGEQMKVRAEKPSVQTVKETKGWHKTKKGKYYYILADGKRAKGWKKISGKIYYFNTSGYRLTGWRTLSGKTYYFNAKGVRQSGWLTLNGKKYYLDPKADHTRSTGWKTIGKSRYYFNGSGVMKTGWLKKGGKYYYLKKTGAMAKGWYTVSGKKYYFDKTTGARAVGWKKVNGYEYYFNQSGALMKQTYTPDGAYVDANGKKLKKSTLKEFLQIAVQPVGSTMYVWGGGWNKADTGAGEEAVTIGVSPRWKQFFQKQNSSYDYNTTRYQIHDGLDCSGFVGWAVYNAFNTKSGNAGYVMKAEIMSRTFADYGWGTFRSAGTLKDFRAGDICSTSGGHVYIVIGQCPDGSVVLVHASPKGVMLTGTWTRNGNAGSEAIKLATQYMKRYYPAWYKKYPDSSRNSSYLTNYSRMRWSLSGKKMMTDPEGLAGMDAASVLRQIYGG